MTNDPNDTDRGRGSLRDQLPHVDPPPELEHRVRATLEARGLVRHEAHLVPDPTWPLRRMAWTARLGLLAAGVLMGILIKDTLGDSGRPTGAAAAGQYVLLLYNDPADDTGAVHVARAKEYGRWASTLGAGAKWVGGHELGSVVERLGPASSRSASETDRLAGYFVIEAPSRERATEVARSCPHIKYGGRVVVMTIAS